jgi:hypothetical protein
MFIRTSFRGKPSYGAVDDMERAESGLRASPWVERVEVSIEEAKGVPP